MVGRAGGDSSESHDTDHLADEEPLDELDSPPIVCKLIIFVSHLL